MHDRSQNSLERFGRKHERKITLVKLRRTWEEHTEMDLTEIGRKY
jgi:hypothetical protein